MEWSLYLGLALSAFTSATFLPGSSEVVLTALVYQGHPLLVLFTIATLANTAGSILNWWLGREVHRFSDLRWFPVSPEQLKRARGWNDRYGRWALLLSGLPFVGDPLTVVAGLMRHPLASFVSMVLLAKGCRYALVLWVTDRGLMPVLQVG